MDSYGDRKFESGKFAQPSTPGPGDGSSANLLGTAAAVLDAPAGTGEVRPGGAAWYDMLYRSAGGELKNVPWCDGRANPSLVAWLNSEATGRVRPGSRAIVVGCGVGDDVVELINRGYDAMGFDVSPTAIEWARRRFPAMASAFCVADLFGMPTRFRHRFELVVEAYTLQSLDPCQRERAAQSITSLCGPRGVVVAIARARAENEMLEQFQGPPWPLCKGELCGLLESCGMKPLRAVDDFVDDETPPMRRLRGVFEHA